jgi:AcrR family transcriptional regulator
MTRERVRDRDKRRDRVDRAAERIAKRGRLLEAAITVVRREGPKASMDAIAAEAGITKPIVYRVFGDREGLTDAVADHFAEELSSALASAIEHAPDDRARVARTIDAYVSFIEREPQIVRFVINQGIERSDKDGVALSGFVDKVGKMITQAIGEGLRARGLDSGAAEPWAYAIVGAVHLAGDWWLERKVMPRERLVEYLTALVWDGMDNFTVAPGTEDNVAPIELKGQTG